MDIKTAIENLLLGIFASTLVWAVFSKAIQPRLGISKDISKVPSLIYKAYLFRIKIENLGLFEVYDVQLMGRFQIFGLSTARPDKPSIYIACVGNGNHPYIEGYSENRKLDVTGREFLVRPTSEAKRQLGKLWGLREKDITVETILRRDKRNCLDVTVIACHKFSSVRRAVKKRYYRKDIHQQYFANKGLELSGQEIKD